MVNEIHYKNREYSYAETHVGDILYYKFGGYVQYRNLSENDFAWSIVNEDDFTLKFDEPVVQIFSSKRITGLDKGCKVNNGGDSYQLCRKKKYDNYIYEVNTTLHKVYPKTKYPDMKFIYTKYYVPALKMLDRNAVERMKVNEIYKFNKRDNYDVATVSAIIDKLYEMIEDE